MDTPPDSVRIEPGRRSRDGGPGMVRLGGLLLVFLAAYFPEVVVGLNTFYFSDFSSISYPNAYYFRECFWQGEVPLWNPYNGAGAPFLASWFTMVLYPPSLFYLILPLKVALGWFGLLHAAWGGLGAYVLALAWTRNRMAAALAGVVFALNGMNISSILWPAIIAAQSWMPWVIWINQRAVRRGGRWLSLAIVVGTLQMFSGGPENILLTWIGSTLVLAVDLASGRAAWLTQVGRYALVVLVITLMAAMQLLPFVQLLLLSNRIAGFWGESSPLPSWGLANLIYPLFYTVPYRHGLMAQPLYFLIGSYYCGGVAVLCFLCATLSPAGRRLRLMLGLSLVFGILALGGAGYLLPFLVSHFPYLSLTRYPFKYFYLAVLGLSLVVALVWSRLDADPGDEPRPVTLRVLFTALGCYLAILSFLVWFEWCFPISKDVDTSFAVHWRNAVERAILALALVGLVWARRNPAWFSRRPALNLMILLVVWLDLVSHQPCHTPTVTTAVFEPGLNELQPAPTLGQGRVYAHSKSDRILSYLDFQDPVTDVICKRRSLAANLSYLDKYAKFLPVETMYLRGQLEVKTWLDRRNYLGTLGDFLGILYHAVVPKTYDWLLRTNTMPLVYCGQAPLFQDLVETVNGLANDKYDLREFVYLPKEDQASITERGKSSAQVRHLDVGSHRIEFGTSAAEPVLVTLAQSYYPAWQAFVDGQPTRLYRANHAYQALQVPAGTHHVRVQYLDATFRWGLVGALILLAGLVAAIDRTRLYRQ